MANDVFGVHQIRPAANVISTIYGTGGGTPSILSCLKCCNVGLFDETINLYYGVGVSPGTLIHSKILVPALKTFTICEAWPMSGFGDTLSGQSAFGNVVFTAFADIVAGAAFNAETFITRQSQPAGSAVETLLFQVPFAPTALGAVVPCFKISNNSSSQDTFTIEIDSGGAGAGVSKSIHYQQPIPGNTTITLAEGWLLNHNDIVWIASGAGNCVFTMFLDQVS